MTYIFPYNWMRLKEIRHSVYHFVTVGDLTGPGEGDLSSFNGWTCTPGALRLQVTLVSEKPTNEQELQAGAAGGRPGQGEAPPHNAVTITRLPGPWICQQTLCIPALSAPTETRLLRPPKRARAPSREARQVCPRLDLRGPRGEVRHRVPRLQGSRAPSHFSAP